MPKIEKNPDHLITKIAENIQLLGHLYTTITEITRKMQDSHLRFVERTAEKMGSR